jgi:NADH dehydrogenase
MPSARTVIVGSGFAGFHAARRLSRLAGRSTRITVVSTTDYFLYVPLLPQVATGVLDPRRVAVSLTEQLPGVRLIPAKADRLDLAERRVGYRDLEGNRGEVSYDRLVLAIGSVNKLLPIPGVGEHAHGFRGLPEALYLRDHMIRQIELAAATDDPAERAARCTFVVVGAGYTGTEVAAQGQLFTNQLAARQPRLRGVPTRWMVLDVAPRVLPELDQRLSRATARVLRRRGVRVLVRTSVAEATGDGVRLTDGTDVSTRTLVWCVGVRPDPLVEGLGLPTEKGRLVVDRFLGVPGFPEVFACGDVAAVPDLTRPGAITPMTAQHAMRQGKTAAGNVAASYGHGTRRPYRHHDLGFLVDLGGLQAAANPLRIPLRGPLAGVLTRGYHLFMMPANRLRVAADWLLEAVQPPQAVQLGLIRSPSVPLDTDSPELAVTPLPVR